MLKKFILAVTSGLLLTGCFAESLTLVSSGAGVSQGRMVQSSLSSAASYGIKKTTGKFPLEHVIKQEKQRIAKKTSQFEKKIIENTRTIKNKIEVSKAKSLPIIKENVENQTVKLNRNLLKIKTFAVEKFKHKPRFSYKVK